MGIGPVDPDAKPRAVLVAAVLLALSGLAALSLVDAGARGHAERFVAPTQARSPAATYVDLIEGTTTTSWRNRTRPAWAVGGYMGGFRRYGEPSVSPRESGEPQPGTQFDAAVPAAGAQVSAGQGEDSCTTVQMTAITPEGCPPPSGDGPVVVRYEGDDPEPDVDAGPRQDTIVV